MVFECEPVLECVRLERDVDSDDGVAAGLPGAAVRKFSPIIKFIL